MKRFVLAALLCFGACAQNPAMAHAISTSFVLLDAPAADGPVGVRWDLSVHDIVWSVFIDRDFDGTVTWAEVKAAEVSIEAAVLGQIAVQRGGASCALRIADLALAARAEQNFLSVAMVADCPRAGLLGLGGGLFMSGDASQRVLLSATRGAEKLAGVISPATPQWQEP